MKVLENNEVKLEYELDPKGFISKSIITTKNFAENINPATKLYTEDRPLRVGETYHYISDDGFEYGLPNTKIDYTILSENSFICDVKSILEKCSFDKNLIAFLIWFSLDNIEDVIIKDKDIIATVKDIGGEKTKLDKRLFDSLSNQIIDEVENYIEKRDNKDYIMEILTVLSEVNDSYFKKALELASKI